MAAAKRFRFDNTEGYSARDLVVLNSRFEEAVYLPANAQAAMSDLEFGSWADHCAETVQAEFDADHAAPDPLRGWREVEA